MKITAADWRAGKLTLTTSDPEAIRFAHGFEEGDYSLSKSKKKRSLDSNAYLWVLIDKLAAVTGLPKSGIYRNAVLEIGGNCETVLVKEEAADALCEGWKHNGIGWPTEIDYSTVPGMVTVRLYYGSSTYDRATMSRLIDYVIEDCRALGIETLPPHKLAAMM